MSRFRPDDVVVWSERPSRPARVLPGCYDGRPELVLISFVDGSSRVVHERELHRSGMAYVGPPR